jgi:hypothetical protein
MPEPRVSAQQKAEVKQRAKDCCEYCGSQEEYSPDTFSVEHIIPLAKGGTNETDNLANACQGCNNHKFVSVEAIDPYLLMNIAISIVLVLIASVMWFASHRGYIQNKTLDNLDRIASVMAFIAAIILPMLSPITLSTSEVYDYRILVQDEITNTAIEFAKVTLQEAVDRLLVFMEKVLAKSKPKPSSQPSPALSVQASQSATRKGNGPLRVFFMIKRNQQFRQVGDALMIDAQGRT